MKLLTKLVVITDGESYLVHGSSNEDAAAMFKTMQPLWAFDPEKETVHVMDVSLDIEDRPLPKLDFDE